MEHRQGGAVDMAGDDAIHTGGMEAMKPTTHSKQAYRENKRRMKKVRKN